MHALVIEDRFLISSMIEDELRELGYTSFDVVDREDVAVSAAERRCPDLITADDCLSNGSGVEAVQRICTRRIIPVVFIVGNPHEIEPPVPFAAVIGKPFGSDLLKEAIGAAVELARTHASIGAV